MSFGFSVGDIITVSQLAWSLYRDCYKIARGAPQEFQLLVGEISTLSNSLSILQEEVKDPQSTLVRAGEDRVRMVNEMVLNVEVTLRNLEKVAKKYEILGSTSKKKQFWGKFKWSLEFSSLDALRNKLVYHNTVMNLLLTSIGNSSLQRIESSTGALENDVRDIKAYITGQSGSDKSLTLSFATIDGDKRENSLSAILMRNAEVLQPWSTIGVDQWIESGRWWLLRAQMELSTISSPGQDLPLAPYASLIKASWILVDIIACHPQVPFLSASTHTEVQILSAELKAEFKRLNGLGTIIPDLSALEDQDLRIWESQTKGPLLRPSKGDIGHNQIGKQWRVDGREEILFQRFAVCQHQALPESVPCISLLLLREETRSLRLLATNQNGSVVMAISSSQQMDLRKVDGTRILVNGEQLTFSSNLDADMLCSLIEGINFYYFDRGSSRWAVSELKAFMLLHALKAKRREVVTLLSERFLVTTNKEATPPAVTVTREMAYDQSKYLLDNSVTARIEIDEEDMPLFQWAILCGNTALVSILITQKVKASGENWHGETPLTIAAGYGLDEMVNLLLDDKVNNRAPNGKRPLCEAAYYGHLRVMRTLLRGGAEVDSQSEDTLTPLSHAARNGHSRCVQLLVDKGADLEHCTKHDFTPLMEACDMARDQCIAILLEEGANTLHSFDDGRSTYHMALEGPNTISSTTFDLLSAKYFAQMRRDTASTLLPPTTGTISFFMDTDWSALYLDSPHAYFVHPENKPLPAHLKDSHNHYLRIDRPPNVESFFFKWTYSFTIVYRTPELYFSVGHGSLGTQNRRGRVILTVKGGGDHGVEAAEETTTTGYGTNFQSLAPMKIDTRT